MKKKLCCILVSVVSVLAILMPALFCVACSVAPRTEADVIPESMGEAEGLYLYRGNERSLTDGSEKEKLLISVTVGENTYGEDEFIIHSYRYVSETFEIFYLVEVGGEYRVYHYNYLSKTSGDVCAVPTPENPQDYKFKVSDTLVYLYNNRTAKGVLFSRNAKLLYEGFPLGILDSDLLYDDTEDEIFRWFMNGEYREVSLLAGDYVRESLRLGNYMYLLGKIGVYAVSLNTGEAAPLNGFDWNEQFIHSDGVYERDGSLYLLLKRTYDTTNERLYAKRFYVFSGNNARLIYDFGDDNYSAEMRVNGEKIFFRKSDQQGVKYYGYNTVTGEFRRVARGALRGSVSPDELNKEEKTEPEELTVGSYTFYVTSMGYDDEPDYFMGGSHYTKTCYYLMRRYGGKEEVMQYNLHGSGYFFDDIREF